MVSAQPPSVAEGAYDNLSPDGPILYGLTHLTDSHKALQQCSPEVALLVRPTNFYSKRRLIMAEFYEDVHISSTSPSDASGLPERSTNRLQVDSWERSNRKNGRAGDAISLHWMRPEAKPFIGWWDSTDPENPVCKAWLGAHDEANNPEAAPHRHFSIEVTDSSGQMQTRLGIPYDRDHTNITTSSADFTVRAGTLRVAQSAQLQFSTDIEAKHGGRWEVSLSKSEDLEITYSDSSQSSLEPVARLNAATGRLEVQSVEIVDLVLKDRKSGSPTRVFVEDGQIKLEAIQD